MIWMWIGGVKLKEAPVSDARIVKEADDSEKAASSNDNASVAQNPSVKSVHEARGKLGKSCWHWVTMRKSRDIMRKSRKRLREKPGLRMLLSLAFRFQKGCPKSISGASWVHQHCFTYLHGAPGQCNSQISSRGGRKYCPYELVMVWL